MSQSAIEQAPAPAGRRTHTAPSETLLYTLVGVMVFFWSLNYVVGKVALREFPPLLLGGLRTAVAGTLILPVYLWEAYRSPGQPSWKWKDVPLLLGLGVVGVAMNQVFFILGLSRTTVAHAAILVGLGPILVLLTAAALRMERITPGKVLGMAVALAGVAALQWSPAESGGPSVLGNLFIFLSSVAFAVFTVAGKRITGYHGTITVSTFAYAGGALVLAPMTLWLSAGFSYAQVSAAGWASLLYMAAFPSVLCYLIYYWALTHISASRVSAFCYLQPPVATLLAVVLLGEALTLPLMAGGALVFAGVYVTERS